MEIRPPPPAARIPPRGASWDRPALARSAPGFLVPPLAAAISAPRKRPVARILYRARRARAGQDLPQRREDFLATSSRRRPSPLYRIRALNRTPRVGRYQSLRKFVHNFLSRRPRRVHRGPKDRNFVTAQVDSPPSRGPITLRAVTKVVRTVRCAALIQATPLPHSGPCRLCGSDSGDAAAAQRTVR
ncbi:MAG: hypothetical protein RL077_2106 [Verrucomicrobiota bacterium]